MITPEKASQILIDECQRLEPCLAEVCVNEVSETKVVFENTDFSVATSSQSTVLGLRVVNRNRLGFVTTNAQDEASLKLAAREAQMVARLSPESPYHDIAMKQKSGGLFSMHDEKLAHMQPKEILRLTEFLVDEARKDPRVRLDRAEMSLNTATKIIQNSNGVFQKATQITCGWGVMGMAKDGDEVTSFDYDGDTSQFYASLEEKIQKNAKEFRESVIGSLGAAQGKSYKGPVLFHPAAIASLIAGHVGFNVNARAQQDGMSKWNGLLGKKVAADVLSFMEDPLDESRPGSWSPFDREGVPTSRHDIIKNGVLNFTAHNAFTAKRGQAQLTGNAVGSSRTLPSIGLHGLTIAPGKSSDSDLYSALNRGLVLKRFSGNSDPVSGQFSGIAKNSWWVENGKRTSALKEVMVAGNMFDLLQNIKLIGSNVIRQSGTFDSPYILIDGVSVTGA